jgi:hypothetical protein
VIDVEAVAEQPLVVLVTVTSYTVEEVGVTDLLFPLAPIGAAHE